jgi:hypothetical protein
MVPKLKVHFWNISGYVNIDIKTKSLIFEKILRRFSINEFAKKTGITNVSIGHFLKSKDSFMRISNLLSILNILKIPKKDVEIRILNYRDSSSKHPFPIKFPYYISPLDIRVVGVLIGDGNIHMSTGVMRWIQKDVSPLKNLIEELCMVKLSSHTNNTQITIPAFFGKILSHSLKLNLNQLNSEKFIERCLELPKVYSLSLLIAIIEDEGNIDSKNFSSINIRMSSKEKIIAIKKLCDHLSYKTSQIKDYKNSGAFGEYPMYKICILSDGIKKFGYDLTKLRAKYGRNIGFWKKENDFIKRWSICTNKKAEKDREGRKIHNDINELFKKHKKLSPLIVSNLLKIPYNRAYDLIKNMYWRGEIIKIKKGIYAKS